VTKLDIGLTLCDQQVSDKVRHRVDIVWSTGTLSDKVRHRVDIVWSTDILSDKVRHRVDILTLSLKISVDHTMSTLCLTLSLKIYVDHTMSTLCLTLSLKIAQTRVSLNRSNVGEFDSQDVLNQIKNPDAGNCDQKCVNEYNYTIIWSN
jgi:hypothetical protein